MPLPAQRNFAIGLRWDLRAGDPRLHFQISQIPSAAGWAVYKFMARPGLAEFILADSGVQNAGMPPDPGSTTFMSPVPIAVDAFGVPSNTVTVDFPADIAGTIINRIPADQITVDFKLAVGLGVGVRFGGPALVDIDQGDESTFFGTFQLVSSGRLVPMIHHRLRP